MKGIIIKSFYECFGRFRNVIMVFLGMICEIMIFSLLFNKYEMIFLNVLIGSLFISTCICLDALKVTNDKLFPLSKHELLGAKYLFGLLVQGIIFGIMIIINRLLYFLGLIAVVMSFRMYLVILILSLSFLAWSYLGYYIFNKVSGLPSIV